MKKLFILLLVLSWAGTASAGLSKAGSAGAQFLKIGVGSKYQGMGEASVATVNDVYAMYWNPAGLVEVENYAIGFTNVNWLLDIDLNYVAAAKYFEEVGVFGISAAILSMDEQEITTFEEEDGTGRYYSAASYAVGFSFARQLTDKFAFGASVKYIEERIDNERARGYAFDFGTLLYTGFRSLRLGMSINNMGPEMKFTGTDLDVRYDPPEDEIQTDVGNSNLVSSQLKTTPYDLPMIFKVGLAYDIEFGSKSLVTLCADLRHPNDNIEQGNLGAQFAYDDRFFLRGGYKINYDEETFSLGGGLVTPISSETRLYIDYAWQDFGRLEATHKFSIGFTF
ncbi:MAG: PorV/PorQ family protein [candidate division Zixibacteria bacterium]|nr:PorV/PorQ family protein [candidate division Zixibacteria bacterium]MDD5426590.1 PorV/PorQ family protein [candidate division Zixibacteria bacterium]